LSEDEIVFLATVAVAAAVGVVAIAAEVLLML
jgi:hypothetical protein